LLSGTATVDVCGAVAGGAAGVVGFG